MQNEACFGSTVPQPNSARRFDAIKRDSRGGNPRRTAGRETLRFRPGLPSFVIEHSLGGDHPPEAMPIPASFACGIGGGLHGASAAEDWGHPSTRLRKGRGERLLLPPCQSWRAS